MYVCKFLIRRQSSSVRQAHGEKSASENSEFSPTPSRLEAQSRVEREERGEGDEVAVVRVHNARFSETTRIPVALLADSPFLPPLFL